MSDARQDGNARKAAVCFTEDAIYSSPPAPAHQGREKLFQLFGGDRKQAISAKIQRHHFVFDPDQQIGAAEFTIQYHLQAHAVVLVKLSHGLISNWRGYDIASGLSRGKFVGLNVF